MVLGELWAALSGVSGAALACCFVAAAVALRWSSRRTARASAVRARRRQKAALDTMDKAAQRFRLQNPDLDSEALLALPLPQLVQKLHSGDLSPEAVLFTYMGKAWEVNKGTNCVTTYLADCETQLCKVPRQGLLYGVPVSLKECFSYKGQDSTLGLSLNQGVPAEADCVVVQVLKLQGALPFVHTNVPQSMFSFDCSNPLFGPTMNPWNSSKSPGGSSGGEGALIAAGGSPLGLGTDIGGSIRFPSAFCGICGLKPTGNRLSKSGLKGCVYGQVAVQLAVGPMARDVESLALCLRALLCEDMFRLDPTVPPLPFREEVYRSSQPLRVGYYETDNYTMPTPAMKRALLETKQRLEVAGHTLVPFLPSNIPHALETLGTGGLFSDGGATFLQNFKGDFVDPCLGDLISILRLPGWLKGLLAFMMKPLLPRLSSFLNSMKSRSAGKLWELHHEIEVYRHSVMAQWRALELDVLLTPMLGPALDLNGPGKATGCEEERGAACGCAVRGSALAGRAVSAVHAGGGAADEPGQAALLTAAHPAPEAPRPARSCIQPGQGCVAAPPGSVQPGLRLPSPSSVAPYKKPRPTESGPHFLPRSALCPDHPPHRGSQRAWRDD
ncbi:fatty-acid amide hydrolase 1 isoform X1 [Ovis aries]|uniref:Fatty acid amide hydrolase n=1 Tax=Ovis aries TaxID=9940 RepID=A0AC11ALX6_SHEEP|nr:fatty-acid amide hydrolase 1 isoform X1 [Ovis aries]